MCILTKFDKTLYDSFIIHFSSPWKKTNRHKIRACFSIDGGGNGRTLPTIAVAVGGGYLGAVMWRMNGSDASTCKRTAVSGVSAFNKEGGTRFEVPAEAHHTKSR